MAFPKKLKQLCTPAYLYFVLSFLGLTLSVLQNLGRSNQFCLGNFSCRVPSKIALFIVQVIFILLWTYILNLICKDGNTTLSWLLVLMPIILNFIVIGMLMLHQNKMEQKNKDTEVIVIQKENFVI